ncbi:hypothetical protein OLX02_01570 [Novosphingobium sp. KCTC 2891]|nr:hypothetical protein [Novosphingobium sp. KCTC 2891]MCW1381503.1 hypothetical protein [Novosphingobium sp. KCTC 2891]
MLKHPVEHSVARSCDKPLDFIGLYESSLGEVGEGGNLESL